MRTFTTKDRKERLENLQTKVIDLLVIGGGITGAGIALDATTRGLRTAVLDMQDFSAGTSSRSTKLIHGGLRYLKQMQVQVVAEVGRERSIVYKNAPHLTTPLWMLLPFYKEGTFGPFSTNLGLMIYDRLARVHKNERRQMLSVEETLIKEPLLQEEGLRGAGYYVEYRTDDARLTIEVLKKAVELGAEAFNYAEVKKLLYDRSGRIIGVYMYDHVTEQHYQLFAQTIVNATGPWVDHIRNMDQSAEGKLLYITKGVHLIFRHSDFPLQQPVYFDVADGRMVFAIPRGTVTYVGTTDTPYYGSYVRPTITEEDEVYIVAAINTMFPTLNITREMIVSKYAGLRPLIAEEGKKVGEISRKDEIFISPSGLISIAGGKLTGYRKMAQKVVDQVAEKYQKEQQILYTRSTTEHIRLAGGEFETLKEFRAFQTKMIQQGAKRNIARRDMEECIQTYGKNSKQILEYVDELAKKSSLRPKELLIVAQLMYSARFESIHTLTDFFIRRTSRLYFNIDDVQTYKELIAEHMSSIFNWSEEQKTRHMRFLEEELQSATLRSI